MDATQQLEELLKPFGLTHDEYMALVRVHDYVELVTVLDVLKTKHFRSVKRKRAHQSIQDWLHDRKTHGRTMYPRPLRPWLYDDLKPRWPTEAIDVTLQHIKRLQYDNRVPTNGGSASRCTGAPSSTEPTLVEGAQP